MAEPKCHCSRTPRSRTKGRAEGESYGGTKEQGGLPAECHESGPAVDAVFEQKAWATPIQDVGQLTHQGI